MICPHCKTSVLRRDGDDAVCVTCGYRKVIRVSDPTLGARERTTWPPVMTMNGTANYGMIYERNRRIPGLRLPE